MAVYTGGTPDFDEGTGKYKPGKGPKFIKDKPYPMPGPIKGKPIKGKPINGKPIMRPMPIKGKPIMRPMPIDDKIVRTMPITEKQLGQIKKMYKLK